MLQGPNPATAGSAPPIPLPAQQATPVGMVYKIGAPFFPAPAPAGGWKRPAGVFPPHLTQHITNESRAVQDAIPGLKLRVQIIGLTPKSNVGAICCLAMNILKSHPENANEQMMLAYPAFFKGAERSREPLLTGLLSNLSPRAHAQLLEQVLISTKELTMVFYPAEPDSFTSDYVFALKGLSLNCSQASADQCADLVRRVMGDDVNTAQFIMQNRDNLPDHLSAPDCVLRVFQSVRAVPAEITEKGGHQKTTVFHVFITPPTKLAAGLHIWHNHLSGLHYEHPAVPVGWATRRDSSIFPPQRGPLASTPQVHPARANARSPLQARAPIVTNPHNETAEEQPDLSGTPTENRREGENVNTPDNLPNSPPNADAQAPRPHLHTLGTLKVASLNLRGAGSAATSTKWQQVNYLLREENIGLLALQETHLKPNHRDELNTQFQSRMHILSSLDERQPNSKGVALVLNKQKVKWETTKVTELIPGRALLVQTQWMNSSLVCVLAVYAPNGHQDNGDFWETLRRKFATNALLPKPDIVLGDFNFVEDSIDRLPAHPDPLHPVESFERLKSALSVSDGWRTQNPSGSVYTYTQASTIGNAPASRSRIDRIYVNQKFFHSSRKWRVDVTPIQTDHKMVSVEIADPEAPFIGRGRWKMPLFTMIENKSIIRRIEQMGIRLQEQIANAPQDSPWEPQHLYATFKKDVQTFVRGWLKETIPRLDHQIQTQHR
ncbi:hypothetical protein D9613_008212 [Agrocybe pediades]|uniref:Endonuclease/exonuclease/phosphatase domain-containing protein n=1 Tax=Agrocybe pediades TaxID=84607 RepID=A0A8H4VQQ5_9AGAR|nr:hypothetical protein D9613_008212 [Agrocybe pediades]